MIVSTNEKSVRITSAERYKIFVSSDKVCAVHRLSSCHRAPVQRAVLSKHRAVSNNSVMHLPCTEPDDVKMYEEKHINLIQI